MVSSSILSRSGTAWLVVFGICGLMASEASANCSSFTTKAATALSTARALPSIRSAAPLITAADLKEKGNDTAITGLWQTAVLVDGVVVDQAFETFTSDGNELMIDTTPPVLDNVCNGVWANLGQRKYRIKHPSWTFDLDGTLTGTAVIRTDLVLNKNGNQFTGQVVIFIYDLDGNLVDTTPTFDLKGSRITVD
jgi:hypothetical protein